MRFLIAFAGMSGLLGVAMGAVGRHLVPADDEKAQSALAIAVMIHLVHSVLLVALAALIARRGWALSAKLAAGLFMAGILLFPGAVYAGRIAGFGGSLAPVGGVALMLGWVALTVYGAGRRTDDSSGP